MTFFIPTIYLLDLLGLSIITYPRYMPYEIPNKVPKIREPILMPSKANVKTSPLISNASLEDNLSPLTTVTNSAFHPTFSTPNEPPTMNPPTPPISAPYAPPLNTPTVPQNIASDICCHSSVLGEDILVDYKNHNRIRIVGNREFPTQNLIRACACIRIRLV